MLLQLYNISNFIITVLIVLRSKLIRFFFRFVSQKPEYSNLSEFMEDIGMLNALKKESLVARYPINFYYVLWKTILLWLLPNYIITQNLNKPGIILTKQLCCYYQVLNSEPNIKNNTLNWCLNNNFKVKCKAWNNSTLKQTGNIALQIKFNIV